MIDFLLGKKVSDKYKKILKVQNTLLSEYIR